MASNVYLTCGILTVIWLAPTVNAYLADVDPIVQLSCPLVTSAPFLYHFILPLFTPGVRLAEFPTEVI